MQLNRRRFLYRASVTLAVGGTGLLAACSGGGAPARDQRASRGADHRRAAAAARSHHSPDGRPTRCPGRRARGRERASSRGPGSPAGHTRARRRGATRGHTCPGNGRRQTDVPAGRSAHGVGVPTPDH